MIDVLGPKLTDLTVLRTNSFLLQKRSFTTRKFVQNVSTKKAALGSLNLQSQHKSTMSAYRSQNWLKAAQLKRRKSFN